MAYTIVSFCGGGIRGLVSAKILQKLVGFKPEILTGTSLLAGTSIGADIVGFLVSDPSVAEPNQCVETMIEQFKALAKFFSTPKTDPRVPAYSNTDTVQRLKGSFGNMPLSSLRQQVLLTAFNVGAAPVDPGATPTPWRPLLFTNVPKALVPTGNTSIVEAVTSSGAMPGMLPSYEGNVDGAFVHHDPTLAAIALAVNSGVDLKEIVAICIGTGFMANWIGSDTQGWGAEQWLHGEGSDKNHVPPLLVNDTSHCPILNISLNGTSSTLIPMLSEMLLRGRYVNLNPVLPEYIPENAHSDDQLNALCDATEYFWKSHPEVWDKTKELLSTYW